MDDKYKNNIGIILTLIAALVIAVGTVFLQDSKFRLSIAIIAAIISVLGLVLHRKGKK